MLYNTEKPYENCIRIIEFDKLNHVYLIAKNNNLPSLPVSNDKFSLASSNGYQ